MSHVELAALVARDDDAGEMSGVSCERQVAIDGSQDDESLMESSFRGPTAPR